MLIYKLRDAKTHFSSLIDRAAKGESFVIAKDGKPLVQVVALETPAVQIGKRRGFLAGQIAVPDDFDTMGSAEIAAMFGVDK